MDQITSGLEFKRDNKSKKYEFEVIYNSVISSKTLEKRRFLGFYYLMLQKDFFEEENTWKLVYAIQYLQRLLNNFYKNDPEKPIATFPPIDFTSPTGKPII